MKYGLREGKQRLDIEIDLIKLIHQSNMVFRSEIPPIGRLIRVMIGDVKIELGNVCFQMGDLTSCQNLWVGHVGIVGDIQRLLLEETCFA